MAEWSGRPWTWRGVCGIGVCLLWCATPIAAQHQPLFPIAENGKWGLIDASGSVVLTRAFDELVPYSSYVSGTGEMLVEPRFNALDHYTYGRGRERQEDLCEDPLSLSA